MCYNYFVIKMSLTLTNSIYSDNIKIILNGGIMMNKEELYELKIKILKEKNLKRIKDYFPK